MRALLPTLTCFFLGCGPMTGGPDGGTTTTTDAGCRDTLKSPPNLLENPGFECDGTPSAWRAVQGTLELAAGGRSGRAAKITVNQVGGSATYTRDFAVDAGTRTFCVSAWISGTAPFMRTRVLQVFGGGRQAEVQQADQIFPDFRRTPLGTPLEVGNQDALKLQLVFEVQTNRGDGQDGQPGQTLLIDDVDVWESSARCKETR